jgi:hypothetical protein
VFPVIMALLVASAFLVGTRWSAKPVAPVVSRTIKTQCQIDTREVQQTVEDLRTSVNDRRARKLSGPQFERQVAKRIPKVATAVRRQGVTCKMIP